MFKKMRFDEILFDLFDDEISFIYVIVTNIIRIFR